MGEPWTMLQAGEQARLQLSGAMVFAAGGPIAAAGGDALLLETGGTDDLLLESGDRTLLE